MNEYPIAIANLNDFIFCPISIYFHNLEVNTDKIQYQDEVQLNGAAKHEKCDNATYSTSKNMLQGISVFSEKYGLFGKIDQFDEKTGVLTERKKKIRTIYDGYVYQLYAQYFALQEMGFFINEMRLYSMDDNKVYLIAKPEQDNEHFRGFVRLIDDMRTFSFDGFIQSNNSKCKQCIYEPLCSYSKLKE